MCVHRVTRELYRMSLCKSRCVCRPKSEWNNWKSSLFGCLLNRMQLDLNRLELRDMHFFQQNSPFIATAKQLH